MDQVKGQTVLEQHCFVASFKQIDQKSDLGSEINSFYELLWERIKPPGSAATKN